MYQKRYTFTLGIKTSTILTHHENEKHINSLALQQLYLRGLHTGRKAAPQWLRHPVTHQLAQQNDASALRRA